MGKSNHRFDNQAKKIKARQKRERKLRKAAEARREYLEELKAKGDSLYWRLREQSEHQTHLLRMHEYFLAKDDSGVIDNIDPPGYPLADDYFFTYRNPHIIKFDEHQCQTLDIPVVEDIRELESESGTSLAMNLSGLDFHPPLQDIFFDFKDFGIAVYLIGPVDEYPDPAFVIRTYSGIGITLSYSYIVFSDSKYSDLSDPPERNSLYCYYLLLGLKSLAFLNMRNIELVEHKPNPKVSADYEREFGRPISTYHTLAIKGSSKRYIGEDTDSDPSDIKHRAHIVRGHKRVVKNHPISHFNGTFWIPAHVRGDEELGWAHKDYKIEANPN